MPTVDIAPPNSLLLLMDRCVGRPPEGLARRLIAATSTCVAIGTSCELDGTTRVVLTVDLGEPPHGAPAFDGILDTPSHRLAVCSVQDEVILEIAVASDRTRVRVWANDPVEPSEIDILASPHAS